MREQPTEGETAAPPFSGQRLVRVPVEELLSAENKSS